MTTQTYFDDLGRLDLTVVTDDAGNVTTFDYEAATGRLDYQFTITPWTGLGSNAPDGFVRSATDYDLTGEHPWTSFTIRNSPAQAGFFTLRSTTETVMDDGSTIVVVPVMEALGFGHPFQAGHRATRTDAQGRLDYVLEIHDLSNAPAEGENFSNATFLKAYDYDPMTGNLDYAVIDYRSGLKERIDYNPATGLRQYQLSILADGRTVAQDFDAQGRLDYATVKAPVGTLFAADYDAMTGNLDYTLLLDPDGHSLASDYDAPTGRLNYTVERWADGRMTATDYDQADIHPWTTYTIAYDPQGNISSTTLL
jgi:hypothetical protein